MSNSPNGLSSVSRAAQAETSAGVPESAQDREGRRPRGRRQFRVGGDPPGERQPVGQGVAEDHVQPAPDEVAIGTPVEPGDEQPGDRPAGRTAERLAGDEDG